MGGIPRTEVHLLIILRSLKRGESGSGPGSGKAGGKGGGIILLVRTRGYNVYEMSGRPLQGD